MGLGFRDAKDSLLTTPGCIVPRRAFVTSACLRITEAGFFRGKGE